jgi:hypothetical protein
MRKLTIRVFWKGSTRHPTKIDLHYNPEENLWKETSGSDACLEGQIPTAGIPLTEVMQVEVVKTDGLVVGCVSIQL